MALARTRSVCLLGVEGHGVEVEAHVALREGSLHIVGLPDAVLREARERIRAAIINSGEAWPEGAITVSLSPASLPKRGSGFDLAIAVAVLAAAGEIPVRELASMVLFAELGLDGRTRPVPGVLPAVLSQQGRSPLRYAVAAANATEAALVPEAEVLGVRSLAQLLGWLRGEESAQPPNEPEPGPEEEDTGADGATPLDLADVLGQPTGRKAAEIAAAGGHNLFFLGSPGTGKSMLARRLPTILPPLSPEQSLEVSAVHSVAGSLTRRRPLITEPPFCDPHHTSTRAALVGGGSSVLRPGAASLAHHGILFLDEAPEFDRGVLDALREPVETGEIVVSRSALSTRFPARFMLVLAANPCPCAKPGTACTCSGGVRGRYLSKLSGPLRDRIDLSIELFPVSRAELLADRASAESSRAVAARVARARERSARRLAGTPWHTNADVPGAELRKRFPIAPAALSVLGQALERGRVTARGLDRLLRLSWTLADLAERDAPSAEDTGLALALSAGTGR
jgi:magnesium chelatase family protein